MEPASPIMERSNSTSPPDLHRLEGRQVVGGYVWLQGASELLQLGLLISLQVRGETKSRLKIWLSIIVRSASCMYR